MNLLPVIALSTFSLLALILVLWLWQQNKALKNALQHAKSDYKSQRHQLLADKQAAEQANKAKNRYLSGISHELRTPLNVIMGYAQLLSNDHTDPNHQRYASIQQNCELLNHLIEGILSYSAIESGKLKVQNDVIDVHQLMRTIIDMFQHQADNKGLNFEARGHEDLPQFVKTDPKRLQQVLINLISNAIKFTDHGTVSLITTYRNQVATIQIKDTGKGIRAEDLERIFQPFERTSNNQHIPGTGLGLTITQLMVDLLGGELSVQSEPNTGSVFTLKLMLSQQAQGKQPSQTITSSEQQSNKHILIVDDIAAHRQVCADMLKPHGFEITEADHATRALRQCQTNAPDLAILDVSMPEVDGWTLAEQLRQNGHDFPIIMLSANARDNDPTRHPHHQAYLSKPLQIKQLLTLLNQLLELNWDTQTAQNPEQTEIEPAQLPRAHRKNLLALAEIGHINGLLEQLEQLHQDDLINQNQYNALKQPLQQLNVSRFLQMIESHDH